MNCVTTGRNKSSIAEHPSLGRCLSSSCMRAQVPHSVGGGFFFFPRVAGSRACAPAAAAFFDSRGVNPQRLPKDLPVKVVETPPAGPASRRCAHSSGLPYCRLFFQLAFVLVLLFPISIDQ